MADELQAAVRFEQQGRRPDAEDVYRRLIAERPEFAVAHFNFACFLRRGGRLDEALAEHQRALDLGIDQPEEVLSNMAVICNEQRQDAQARELLERALALSPGYVPALYNLGLWHEEFGERDRAHALFAEILERDPAYFNALVRIAHLDTASGPDDPVIDRLRQALRHANLDPLTHESLHFALAKCLDDCGRFDAAFSQYALGNRLGAARLRRYDRESEEARLADIESVFTRERMASAVPVSEQQLVFVTGMFRSGSTLFEQVLAAHPQVVAGGEIDYFGRALAALRGPFPQSVARLGGEERRRLGQGYLDYLARTFPAGALVTNKRPDAFEWLGLLKSLFPNARFVNTLRHPADTCLSIYFQQLDDRIGYANDLSHIGHRYAQYRRLMTHWKRLFGADIHDAAYDDLVTDPRGVTEKLLRFLGLPWHEGCLDFQRLPNRVRTASVAQVREPLYSRSSGRWRHYERHLAPALEQIGAAGAERAADG